VLLVVACHCGISWCAGGFVGVDVFFVLSGYLITRLLATEFRVTSQIDFYGFFARRARRLLPTGALVLLATTLIAAAILTPQNIAFTGRAALATALYASNIFFDCSASDYFAPNIGLNPLLHTWSLGVEEQFYLLWPLLILLTFRGQRRVRRSIWILGVIAAVSFMCCIYATRSAPTFAFYELPARAWEFAAGGLLALVPVSRAPANSNWAVACGFGGIAMILGTAALLHAGTGFPGWIALFPVGGTVAMLLAGTNAPRRGISAALSAAPLQFLGARSYSWYLWHWPFVVFAAILFPGMTAAGKIAAAFASLLAADLTYRLVERPVRENSYLRARSRLSLGAAAGVTIVAVAASCTLINLGRQQLTQDRSSNSIMAAASDLGDLPEHCWSEGNSFEVRMCEFGDSGASQAVVLFGDSHAMQWINPMRTATKLEGWRLVTVVRPGCAASDINPPRLSSAHNHCTQWRTQAIEKIISLHPSAVVMASFANYSGAKLSGEFTTPTVLSSEEIRLGTRRTLAALSRAGIPIVVLRDTPQPPFDIPGCLLNQVGRPHAAESCEFDAPTALNQATSSAEQAAAEGLSNIYFLDMNDVICPGNFCLPIQHELVVYRDDNHLTGKYAETLAPTLRVRLFEILRRGK